MKNAITHFTFNDILELLKKYDNKDFYDDIDNLPDFGKLIGSIEQYIKEDTISNRCVLGIDIYKYGSYETFKQTLIPFIFKLIYRETIEICIQHSPFLFQNYSKTDIEKSFIDAGDGGYQILETPLHGLVFAVIFEFVLRTYNSYHFFPRMRKITGEISLRYAMTLDKIYGFENNYYGTAIITCSRILRKDHLNRCLIDKAVYKWFLINTNGIENLQIFTIDDVANIQALKMYDKQKLKKCNDIIFSANDTVSSGIVSTDLLKIGNIESKESNLSIYNLHIQVVLQKKINQNQTKKYIVSLGNLNTAGI